MSPQTPKQVVFAFAPSTNMRFTYIFFLVYGDQEDIIKLCLLEHKHSDISHINAS